MSDTSRSDSPISDSPANRLILSQTLEQVAPSPTLAMTQRAREMKAQGRDVLGLSAGEPDFDTPAHINAAAINAIEEGETRYTAVDGIPALKTAICAKFKRDNGLDYAPDQVVASTGGKYVLYAALMATLNSGNEVIVPAPYWVSYPDMVKLAGGTPVIVPAPASQGFVMSPDQLAAAITPKTRWLILNSPSNPTGAVYTADQLNGLAEVLRAHPHVWVMADDIYEHITFDVGFETLAAIAPDLKDRILIVNGASKAYAMTGWRLGFGAGPQPLIKAMTKMIGQSTGNPSSITQHAGVAALNGDHTFLDGWRSAYRRRRDLVVAAMNDIAGIECAVPQGAFYVYPSCEGVLGRTLNGKTIHTDLDFADGLLEAEGVAVVPGTAFGLSPHFRISYATSDEVLTEACARIARYCAG